MEYVRGKSTCAGAACARGICVRNECAWDNACAMPVQHEQRACAMVNVHHVSTNSQWAWGGGHDVFLNDLRRNAFGVP